MIMSIKLYLFYIFIGFILSLGVWLLILFNIDPYKTDFISISAFFASLLIWIFCLFSLLIYYFKIWYTNKEVIYTILPISLRQGFLISLVIVGLSILGSLNILNWWIAGLWALVILITELFFKTRTES